MLEVWRETARRYALLPLRIFLGVTFLYAGLDKLTSDSFFTDAANGSLVQILHGSRDSAAIPGMIDLALKAPHGFGYAIALGEIAVGLGTLVGLLGRVAALGGAMISLSLWLTISWSTTPYYYGNDLAYLMAWLPMVLHGTPYLSLDALLAGRRAGRKAPAAAARSGGGSPARPGAVPADVSGGSARPVPPA